MPSRSNSRRGSSSWWHGWRTAFGPKDFAAATSGAPAVMTGRRGRLPAPSWLPVERRHDRHLVEPELDHAAAFPKEGEERLAGGERVGAETPEAPLLARPRSRPLRLEAQTGA